MPGAAPLDPLMGVVAQIVEDLARPDAHPPGFEPTASAPVSNPQVLLSVLCYCYASGIYASDEIEERVVLDPALAALCGGRWLGQDTLRRFRRTHQPLLLDCLSRVLETTGAANRWVRLPDPATLYARSAFQRWSPAPHWHDTVAEAQERLLSAIRADSIALDD